MSIDGWYYYNHTILPSCAPHEEPKSIPTQRQLVKGNGGRVVLLARLTTDWWYVIKYTPFDISNIKAKRRYEMNKGLKNFDIRVFNPISLCDDIYNVTNEAYRGWPKKYRSNIVAVLKMEEIKKSCE